LSMMAGILATGCVFVAGTSLIGWGIAHLTLSAKFRRVQGSV
jgi:hypothetical protein